MITDYLEHVITIQVEPCTKVRLTIDNDPVKIDNGTLTQLILEHAHNIVEERHETHN